MQPAQAQALALQRGIQAFPLHHLHPHPINHGRQEEEEEEEEEQQQQQHEEDDEEEEDEEEEEGE